MSSPSLFSDFHVNSAAVIPEMGKKLKNESSSLKLAILNVDITEHFTFDEGVICGED